MIYARIFKYIIYILLVPDMTIAGSLSSVHICLDLAQFSLIMGMLGENLGEQVEQFEKPSSYLIDPLELVSFP